jgi:N-methylhydantoinase A
MNMKYIIGTDTGGTFTDCTVLREDGEIFIDKSSTTPHDFSIGVMDAIAEVAKDMGLSVEDLLKEGLHKHGSTVATNALITRTGSKVGLITTRGFEDTTLIMRAIGRVAGLDEYALKHQSACIKPEPVVPKELIKGVTERIDFSGDVVIRVNEQEAREAIRSLVEDHEVEAIAVNFLWGFVNPIHENRIKELIQEIYPDKDLFLSIASELVPVVREYARSNTVILNAFLGKTIRNYTKNLGIKLKESGYKEPLLLMQANGGIGLPEEVSPIGTLGSGPCGGMMASKYMADLQGHKNVITTDMGGTSFDVGLLIDGFWRYAKEPVVERFHITWPMIEIESIGAGGGTLSRVDPVTKRLLVGPKSAGAAPGPVCYDAGGTEPAITDANVILGFLDPDFFLGGRMKLNKAKAEQVMKDKIADPLGMSVIDAAAGIHDIINGHMSDLIRKQVVRTGNIPEEFVIYAFGGSGPVHAAAYGSELGIEKVYVFPTSAVFSAFGISAADVIHTYTTSYRYNMPVDPSILNNRIKELEEVLYEIMGREGIARERVQFRRSFYMRYRRQLNELEIHVPVKDYNEQDILDIMDGFEKRYEDVYGAGSAYRQAGIEVISISIDAIGVSAKPKLKTYPVEEENSSAALKSHREVFFPGKFHKFMDTRIYDYDKLNPGNLVEGPAIVETPITTIVIPPEKSGKMDKYRNIEITLY